MGQIKNGFAIGGLVIAASFYGLGQLGAGVSDGNVGPSIQLSIMEDARAELSTGTSTPPTKELHYLSERKVLCGLVNYPESIGWTPFAYSHSLGLKVAKVWGNGEYENLNRLYGCSFLPMAYVKEWKKPFWGSSSEPEHYMK